MRVYPRDSNSVEYPFKSSQSFSRKPLPLSIRLNSDLLHRLFQKHPTITLKELCKVILEEQGIIIRVQALCKLLLRVGLNRAARHRLRMSAAIREWPKAAK